MKVLIIPDVHLKPFMFKQAAELMERGIAKRAVCLMDIPDDWNKHVLATTLDEDVAVTIHGTEVACMIPSVLQLECLAIGALEKAV